MQMLFRQRIFSWFDSYDIYAEDGSVLYTVKGQLSWGHCLKIFDADGCEVGTVKERVFTFLPKFELFLGEDYIGCISKEFTLFRPVFTLDCNGWQVEGSFLSPRLLSGATRLHPLTVLLAISAGGIFSGTLGMLLALPIVVSVRGAMRGLRR